MTEQELEKNFDDMRRGFTDMRQGMTELKQDVSGLKQDVHALKKDVAVLQHDVSGLKEDMESLTRVVIDHGKQLIELNEKMDDTLGIVNFLKDNAVSKTEFNEHVEVLVDVLEENRAINHTQALRIKQQHDVPQKVLV